MKEINLETYPSKLRSIEDLLIDLSTVGNRLSKEEFLLMSKIVDKLSFGDKLDILVNIPTSIRGIRALARGVDQNLVKSFENLEATDGFLQPLERLITRLKQTVRKSRNSKERYSSFRPKLDGMVRISSISFGLKPKNPFVMDELHLDPIISGIRDLARLTEELSMSIQNLGNPLEDVFIAKGIDKEKLIELIDKTIASIEQYEWSKTDYGIKVITHLKKVKIEASKKKVSWKNIVGGLVIASTIIGGIANAPEAAENIQAACNYVMIGVEKMPMNKSSEPPKLTFNPITAYLKPEEQKEFQQGTGEES